MTRMTRNTGILASVGIAIFAAAGGLLGLPLVAQTPVRLNSKTISVDVRAGRIRTETFLCWIKLSSSVADAEVTRTLWATNDARPAAEWRTVARFPIGGSVSPLYAFGAATYGLRRIEEALGIANASTAERRRVCEEFLRLLQANWSALEAREYAEGIWKAAWDTHALPAASQPARDGSGRAGDGPVR